MRRVLIVVAVVALVAVGCGDGDGGSGTGRGTGAGGESQEAPVVLAGTVNNHGLATVSGTELELEADDFYFAPTFVRADPGTTLKVTVVNEGQASHTLTTTSPDVDRVVPAGQTATVDLELPDSGVVNFFCRFHRDQGMQGAVYFT